MHVAFLACKGTIIYLPQKARAVLTFRCNSHAPRALAEHLSVGGALEAVVKEWLGQYFSELKCRQNLRLSIGLRPSLLAFHTTMSTASARSSFDLGVVGRASEGRGRVDEDEDDDEDKDEDDD